MPNKNNFKWQNFLWSIVIIFGLTLFAYTRFTKSNSIIGFDIYPYALSPYVAAGSLIIILLRILRVISNESFLYIFIATLNIYLGTLGAYLDASSEAPVSLLIHTMFYLNILLAIFIFFDVFRKKQPK